MRLVSDAGYPSDLALHLEFTSEPLWSGDTKAVAIIAEEYETKELL
jgi:hypothetical protein